LYFIDNLHSNGCQCAENWRRKYIEFMLAVFVILFIAGLVFPVSKYMVGILSLVYFILVVAYIVITRQFIDSLTAAHCTCATDSNAFWWLGAINILQIVALFIGVLFALLGLLFTSSKKSSYSKRR
jgi:hypothetical protein